jgi:hypothetical protein
MFLKQRGFKALPITKGFNFSPVALHPNITVKRSSLHLQPLDQGIIKAFKACYRKRMMERLVAKIEQDDSVTELCKEINVLDAVHWISESRKETRIETLSKCFKLSGFPISSEVNSADSDADDAICSILATKLFIIRFQ